ncbi:MAG: glycosyltransferase family 2 protein [Verrucomicrobia bacterium]|nr:glycosyltransferase family 2 protein [Verrucomicrobiota bacterium]
MKWAEQCAVVIPCYNEAPTIAALVQAVREYLPAVIVVDDGSRDATAEVATQAGAEVIRHPRNRGKGAALTSGWRRARERGFGWALCLDGDGQHAPADVPRFLQCAADTGAALVIGNRMTNPAGMPWLRRVVNRWMSRQLSRRAGSHLPDTQCGFRLMRLDAWARLPSQAAHFEIESDVLLGFLAAGQRVEFVPIQVIYKARASKIHPLVDTVRWFRWWWRRGR